MSVKSVMEELHPGYMSRKRKASNKDNGIAFVGDDDHEKDDFCDDIPAEQVEQTEKVQPKRTRKPREKKSVKKGTSITELENARMYTMTKMSGPLDIPGINLNDGEMLVLMKLTPIAVS